MEAVFVRAPSLHLRESKKAVRGYSLIEVILAVTIFSFIAGATFFMFENARQLEAQLARKSELYQTARVAMKMIEDDLRAVYASGKPFDTGLNGSGVTTGERPADRLEFVAVNNRPFDDGRKEIDLTKTVYFVSEKGLVRERYKLLTGTAALVNAQDVQEVVSDRVRGIKFRYFDGSAWQDSWQSSSMKTMPRAIQVTLYIDEEEFTTAVWLPIAASYRQEESR